MPRGLAVANCRWLYLLGVDEALNNLVVAMVFALLVCGLLTLGAYRSRRQERPRRLRERSGFVMLLPVRHSDRMMNLKRSNALR